MLFYLFLIVLITFFLYPFKTYYIFKGLHYCLPRTFRMSCKKKFSWEILFDETCIYDLETSDQLDANKLCGISYSLNPHINSARFGWSYNLETNKMDIHIYCYIDGIRINEYFTSVKIGETFKGVIIDLNDSYYFSIESSLGFINKSIHKNKSSKIKFIMNPFFGGNRSAPHNIKVCLNRIC